MSFGEKIDEIINRKVLACCERIEKEKIDVMFKVEPIKQLRVEINRFLKESLPLIKGSEVKNAIEVPE